MLPVPLAATHLTGEERIPFVPRLPCLPCLSTAGLLRARRAAWLLPLPQKMEEASDESCTMHAFTLHHLQIAACADPPDVLLDLSTMGSANLSEQAFAQVLISLIGL